MKIQLYKPQCIVNVSIIQFETLPLTHTLVAVIFIYEKYYYFLIDILCIKLV